MTSAGAPATVPVLLAAAGAAWEAEALDLLERSGPMLVLSRRCVDLTDLLATATAGLAAAAVVAPELSGLDADSVDTLHRCGVGVVVVAAVEEMHDGTAGRMRRLGVEHVLAVTDLAGLPAAVAAAAAGPGVPGDAAVAAQPDAAGPSEPTAEGRLVAVWGPAGAPGRTTVAVGLAAEIAHQGRDAFLLDVDPYGGTVAQHLGLLDEASGLLAAVRSANAGRLDEDRLRSAARQLGPRLRVLTGLPRPDRWPEVRPAAFEDVLGLAARLAGHVVLDIGFSLETDHTAPLGGPAPQRNQMTLTALGRADEVVVVGGADPVGLARLARGLVELREVLPGVRPRVVVNRTRPSLGWGGREIRGMVEGFVTPLDIHFLPDDRVAADRALMSGRSLPESGDSALRSALAVVAAGVTGSRPSAPPRRGRRRRRPPTLGPR